MEKRNDEEIMQPDYNGILKQKQKGAKAHLVEIRHVYAAIEDLYKKIQIGRKALRGTTVVVDIYAGASAAGLIGTKFMLKHNGTGWILTDAWRGYISEEQNRYYQINYSPAAKKALIKRMSFHGKREARWM